MAPFFGRQFDRDRGLGRQRFLDDHDRALIDAGRQGQRRRPSCLGRRRRQAAAAPATVANQRRQLRCSSVVSGARVAVMP